MLFVACAIVAPLASNLLLLQAGMIVVCMRLANSLASLFLRDPETESGISLSETRRLLDFLVGEGKSKRGT